MPYLIEEHKHRYASWAASRASSVKGCRFTVLQGKMLLEKIGMLSLVNYPDKLPISNKMDVKHKEWRLSIISEAEKMSLLFTHGVAAKLINMYLKTIFVCGGYNSHQNVVALHPPIDAVLLKSLRLNNIGGYKVQWKQAEKAKWSKFSSEEYEKVIKCIKEYMNEKPLWLIEEHWQGYQ
ncbi:MAG: hypothetical protein Q9M14_04645 [Mariprofundaceae bacterium]|nr:hypothetical protein [Mariprofundaceae bacterium]